ncbi:MAG: phosphatase PAP2 family protein [Gammaproteobacteria bacterium]|nr:phosphatase PAP2 family protein [Gammaproteobacteria bacterium]
MENFALNHQLMLLIYAGANPMPWQLLVGTFAAKYLIYFFPLVLIYQGVRHRERRALVFVIIISLFVAFGVSLLIQHFFPTNRPFVDGLVTNLIPHAVNNSFPSDHMLATSTIALGFIFGRVYKLGFFLLLLAFIVGLSRVYLGIHYPLDILGAFILGLVSAFVCVKSFLSSFQKALL